MSCGLPIIATNRGGQVDIIKDEKTGLLVPAGDADSLADAISKLAADTGLRQTIGKNNKETAKQYNITSIARRYVDLFRDILAKSGEKK